MNRTSRWAQRLPASRLLRSRIRATGSRESPLTFGKNKMISRIIAASSIAGAVVSVVLLDPGQFIYPYMGLMAGIASAVNAVAFGSPLLMIILPIIFIVVMIIFGSLVLGTMILLALRSFISLPSSLFRKATYWSALILAISLLCGLALLQIFPGIQETPIEISPAYYAYPVFLAVAAISLYFIDKNTEQGGPPNAHPRHASCLVANAPGTSRATSERG